MSRSFLTPINLNQLELQNARIQNLSTAQINGIATPVSGQLAYDNTLSTLKVYNGTGWTPVGSVSTGSGTPLVAPTSIGSLYLDLSNFILYVAKGTATAADWITVLPYGGTFQMAPLGGSDNSGSKAELARIDHVHRHTDDDHSNIHLNALAAATGDYSMGSKHITDLANPVNPNDAANKIYVDSAVAGLTWKSAVNLLAHTNVALTGQSGTLVIDGHNALNQYNLGYRVLLTGQSTSSENGIYTYTENPYGYELVRTTDSDDYNELKGASVFVQEGTSYGSTSWVQSNHYLASFADQNWVQFSGTGTYTASTGLTLVGTTFSIDSANGYGVRKFSEKIGDGASTSITVTHNFGTRDVQVTVYDASGYAEVMTDITHSTTSAVTLSFAVAPTLDQYRVVVIG